MLERDQRRLVDRIKIPHRAEGLAITPDGETLFVCAHERPELHVIDARSLRLRRTVAIAGGEGRANQLKRVRVSPDGRHVLVSSLIDNHVAFFETAGLRQIGSLATAKAPMGFGFAPDGKQAYVCCHDDALVMHFELETGREIGRFQTAAGCEFLIAYR